MDCWAQAESCGKFFLDDYALHIFCVRMMIIIISEIKWDDYISIIIITENSRLYGIVVSFYKLLSYF